MKTRILTVILSRLLMTNMPPRINVRAVEENIAINTSIQTSDSVKVSRLIARCSLSREGGSKTVYINASIYDNGTMSKIGFKNIKIQRSSDQNNWTTEKTVSDQISEDAVQKKLSQYAVSVKGGYYYRIVLDNYAKVDTWWFPDE